MAKLLKELNMKLKNFEQIKKFPHCSYRVDIDWNYLEEKIQTDIRELNLDLNPDFQRAHVWTESQQIAYCEYILRNGASGRELYFNCAGWMRDFHGPYVIVDGKQRLEAVRSFMNGKIKVFGSYINEYENKPDMLIARFSWNIAALETKEEILQWYLDFNSGGTIHTEAELQKVKNILTRLTAAE